MKLNEHLSDLNYRLSEISSCFLIKHIVLTNLRFIYDQIFFICIHFLIVYIIIYMLGRYIWIFSFTNLSVNKNLYIFDFEITLIFKISDFYFLFDNIRWKIKILNRQLQIGLSLY